MSDRFYGIERAIYETGSPGALRRLLKDRAGVEVNARQISYWRKMGYVPMSHLKIFADVTNIPVDELLNPSTPKSRRTADVRPGPSVANEH